MRTSLGSFLGTISVFSLLTRCGSNASGTTTEIKDADSDASPVSAGDATSEGGGSAMAPSPCQVLGETRITETGSPAKTPALVWTGVDYLVVWTDERGGSGAGGIYAARLSSTGTKAGSEWPIVSTIAPSTSPSLTPMPGGYLVGWQEHRAEANALVTQRLGMDGLPATGSSPIVVASSMGDEVRPQLAPAFGGVAAGWTDWPSRADGGIPGSPLANTAAAWISQLDASGSLLRPPGPILLGSGTAATGFPSLASGATRLAAAYLDYRTGQANLRASLFDDAWAVKADVLVRDAPADAANPHVSWNGEQFVLVWEDLRSGDEQVYLSRISPDGTVGATLPVADEGTGSANWPRASSAGSSTVVVFYQFRDGPPQVYLTFLGSDGSKVGGDLRVSQGTTTTGRARYPSVVRGTGGEYGIVWEDTRFGGNPQILFARVNCPTE